MRAILHHPDTVILGTAAALLMVTFVSGIFAPPLFQLSLASAVVAGVGFLALRFPTPFCVIWLLLAGMSLEMVVADFAGDEFYQPTIAAIKGTGIGLAVLCAIGFGPRLDPLCPAWAFLAMMSVGFVHGLYPGLSTADSLRSSIGSIAPFAFCFCRVPRPWAEAIIRATKWCPLAAVVACVPFALAGLRPLFVDSGGARLAGLGHPAFLANVCLPAIYACLIQLYREGRRGDVLLLIANGLILMLTGARAPVFYGVLVTALSLCFVHSKAFAARDRFTLILLAMAALPVLALLADTLGDVRLFNVVANDADNLSGRSLLWPEFRDAAARSPWFGWGVGAGNAVIPPESWIVQQLRNWSAHNEYLRIDVEGGRIGQALLIGLFAGWVVAHTRRLAASDRQILRLAFMAYAGHALTDNVLISTPACVMFAFVTAAFARPEADAGGPTANGLARFGAGGVGNGASQPE